MSTLTPNTATPLLKYTGHPLVDVGAATITAFVGKQRPEDVTRADLEEVAGYLFQHYNRSYMNSYLSCVFMNSAYFQQIVAQSIAGKKNQQMALDPEKQSQYHDLHLFAFRQPPQDDAPLCGLCGFPSCGVAFREHFPLITGRDVLNFFPHATAGLPICAACMLSVAAMPLGALRCAGRVLLVHADDPALTMALVKENLKRNQRFLDLASAAGDKFPDAKVARTRLMEQLANWAQREGQRRASAERKELHSRPTSVTAYHFTNSGQGPDLDVYAVPAPLLSFLTDAQASQHKTAWNALVNAAWRLNEKLPDAETHRNYLYEDLLSLPEEWPRFVRTYFLRKGPRATFKDDPRAQYRLARDLDLIHWPLLALFLERIVGMDQHRVDTIKAFGDRVALHIAERDSRFWNRFNLAKRYSDLRASIVRAGKEEQKAGRPPLIGYDDFITIFEYGEDDARRDWNLARDLVLIRVVEQLHEGGWFKHNPEALDVTLPAAESSDAADNAESPAKAPVTD